ncbi:aminotransferase class I/II-fold pyridoxal phosphate-dependent enzyme [Candidatus Pelagibacter sp.]|jgi:CDP-6-deoxy-D-xylo-4-hexulose-3-dehydrase|nr:aminotransferase class I/II-fold pyridoxal phosphate-dependent enzyme [Candidatus Pelagibacter sp.]|tara:strand:+ start:1834 stop:3033 length:1200 start_codon:yes stop_codon:yes gene_type:complete
MKNNMTKIPYGLNVYGKEEINAVLKTLKKSTQMGKAVNDFELKISKLFSKKYGLMVNSGSSALLLALKVMNFKKGSEIIAPCLNFGTAISSITLSNLIPIFVDCKINTLQIDIEKIEEKITKKTKALLIPNLIGNLPDWKKIRQIANKYKLLVIEDSADTLGATVNAKPSGIFSDISITSFYGSHIISCAGNGGMLLTNNKNFHTRAKVLRSWGRMSTLIKDSENIKKRLGIKLKGFDYDKKFVFSESGYNFEPSEIGASFGLVQLKKFKKFNMQRNKNFLLHSNFFKKFKDYFIIPKIEKSVKTNFLAYPIILKNNLHFSRKDLQVYLEKHKIQTRPIFSGNILRHPAFSNLISKRNKLQSFKNSDYIMKYGLLIGCHQGLGVNDISYIHKKILAFIN